MNAPRSAEGRIIEMLEQAESAKPQRIAHRARGVGEAALGSETAPVSPKTLRQRTGAAFARFAIVAALVVLAAAAWIVAHGKFYTSGSGLGYLLGLIGGSLMLVLMLYPVRKRVRFMQRWGPLKYWFQFHMVAGILGPVLVLFHSAFHVGLFNAALALGFMVLVVSSGLVGRVLYRKIHHGLYGSHATLKELQQSMTQELEALEPVLRRMPLVKQEVDRFAAMVSHRPQGWHLRAAHFLSLGAKRIAAGRRLRRAIAAYPAAESVNPVTVSSHTNLTDLLRTIDVTLQAAQRTAQFTTYERLFSLWHIIHIPFIFMLAITAVIHVVAVHAY